MIVVVSKVKVVIIIMIDPKDRTKQQDIFVGERNLFK